MVSMASDSSSLQSVPKEATINSGGLLKSSSRSSPLLGYSISEQVVEDYSQPELTPFELLWMALDLTKQALMSLPLVAYISFALSLLFIVFFAAECFFGLGKKIDLNRKPRSSGGHIRQKRSNRAEIRSHKAYRANSL